jgi:rubrerythrin
MQRLKESRGVPKSVKGTRTEKNWLKPFAGESEARNRYTCFAGTACKHPQAFYEVLAETFQIMDIYLI